MDSGNIELARKQFLEGKVPADSVLSRLLAELPAADVERLKIKAVEGKMALELETLRMSRQFHASQAEIKALIDSLKELEMANRNPFGGHEGSGEFQTATGKVTITPKRMCYVATAVYGSADHPNVELLRHFRAESLERTCLGRGVSRLYSIVGPLAATSLLGRGLAAKMAKLALDRFCSRLRSR